MISKSATTYFISMSRINKWSGSDFRGGKLKRREVVAGREVESPSLVHIFPEVSQPFVR